MRSPLAWQRKSRQAFAELASDTQRTRRYITERFLERFGKLPVATLERRHVEKILAEEKPGQKKIVLSMLRTLIALAITNGDREDDPTSGIKIKRPKGDGWHTWSEEDRSVRGDASGRVTSMTRLCAGALHLPTSC
jgi:hypothetical protein